MLHILVLNLASSALEEMNPDYAMVRVVRCIEQYSLIERALVKRFDPCSESEDQDGKKSLTQSSFDFSTA